jgi:hypothetical protein
MQIAFQAFCVFFSKPESNPGSINYAYQIIQATSVRQAQTELIQNRALKIPTSANFTNTIHQFFTSFSTSTTPNPTSKPNPPTTYKENTKY